MGDRKCSECEHYVVKDEKINYEQNGCGTCTQKIYGYELWDCEFQPKEEMPEEKAKPSKWIVTKNAKEAIPKDGCYWVSFYDPHCAARIWVDEIFYSQLDKRWEFTEDRWPVESERFEQIVAYMKSDKPDPFDPEDLTHMFDGVDVLSPVGLSGDEEIRKKIAENSGEGTADE